MGNNFFSRIAENVGKASKDIIDSARETAKVAGKGGNVAPTVEDAKWDKSSGGSKPGISGAKPSGGQAGGGGGGGRPNGSTPSYGDASEPQSAAASQGSVTRKIPKTKTVPTGRVKASEETETGIPPITIDPASVAGYEDADDVTEGNSKSKDGKKASARPRASSFYDSVAKAKAAINNANQISPEDVAYESVEVPALLSGKKMRESDEQIKKNRRQKRGLGKGLGDMLTGKQKGKMKADVYRDYMSDVRKAADDYQARKQQASDDARMARANAISDALRQLRMDREARADDIVRSAQDLNDGARKLLPGQMGLLGTSQQELEALGLADLLPPAVRYDGTPGEEYVKPGDEQYTTYRRRDDKSSLSPLEWLSKTIDSEVAQQTSVFMEQDSDNEKTTFQDLVNGVEPTEIGSDNKRVRRMRESRVQTQMAWLNPIRLFFDLFHADTIEDEGFEYVMASMSDDAMNAVNNVSVAYHGLSINSCLKLIMARGGIAYDNFGKMKPQLRDEIIMELCKDIIRSEAMNGLPNNIVEGKAYDRDVRDDKGHLVLGGTRCFPFGYIPNDVMDEIMSIPDNKLSKLTKEQVRKLEWETFINLTYPNIFANADKAQLRAYQNGMTALLELDGQNPNYFDIPMDDEMTIQQQLADVKDISDPAVNNGTLVTVAATHEAAKRAQSHYRHTPHTRMAGKGDNRNGHVVSALQEAANAGENVFRSGSNYIRANGANGLFVMGSGIGESALAAAENCEVNWLNLFFHGLSKDLRRKGVDMDRFLPTDYLISWVRSPKARECMDVANMLYHLDGMGWDMISLYRENGYGLNRADMAKFVNDLRGMEGKFADFNAMMSNLEHFWSMFQLGQGLFQKSDAQQWCITMLQLMAEAEGRGGGAGVFDAKQMEDAISMGGVEQFMNDMMFNSEIARDAFMFTGLTSFSSKNPYSHLIERLFKVNGYTQALFTMFVNKYPTYGFNSVALNFPMFNSVSYIVNTMSAEVASACGFQKAALDFRNYQAGGRTAIDEQGNMSLQGWLDGLRRNMMYDAVHHGNKLVLTTCMYLIIGALGGLGLPDDKDKYGVMEEYRIGGANGTPVKYAWWLDDIMGLSAPAAYAIWLKEHGAYDRNGNHHDVSVDDYTNVFWNGAIGHVNGTAIFATIEMIRDLDTNMDLINRMMTDPEGYAAYLESSDELLPESPSEAMQAFVEHYLVANVTKNITPTFVRELLPMSKGFIFRDQESDAHTAWSVWATEPTAWNPSGKTKQEAMGTLDTSPVGYLEGRRRQDSQDNPIYALLNNIWHNHWGLTDILNGGKDRQETGYMYDEQAVGTKTDDRAEYYMERFRFDPMNDGTFIDDDGNPILDPDDRREKLNEAAVDLIQYMEDNWQTADEAVANGFVLPYGARINAGEYCWYIYNKTKADWQAQEGQVSNDEFWDIYHNTVEPTYQRYIKDLYYGWHLGMGDDTIPSTAPKYVRQESSYLNYYVDENGNSANWMDYINGDAVQKTYAFGDPPVEFMPLTMPRTEGKGFNEETIPYFDVPGYTNYEALADELRGKQVKYGLNKGEDLEQVYFGGQPDGSLSIPTDGSMQTTIDLRNYRKSEFAEIPEVLRNPTKESIESFLGIKTNLPIGDDEGSGSDDSDSNGNGGGSRNRGGSSRRSGGGGGGGYRYYGGGGGGGGSSYNPRIYSSPRQIYSTRAAGMQSHTPYKATSTYLRPGFYTKGSREAYKRSDM